MHIQSRDREIILRSGMVKVVKEHFALLKMCISKRRKKLKDVQMDMKRYMKRAGGAERGRKGKKRSGGK